MRAALSHPARLLLNLARNETTVVEPIRCVPSRADQPWLSRAGRHPPV